MKKQRFHLCAAGLPHLLIVSLFALLTFPAQAQNDKDKVVIVDDEECGCELVFIDGIQTIEREGHFGFKREDGTVFVEPKYRYVGQFTDGFCVVYNDNMKCGIINRAGIEVVPTENDETTLPKEGMIRVRKGNLWGFYDTTGRKVIDYQYRTESDFSEGLAVINVDIDSMTVKYGYINKNNEIVIPARYEFAMTFFEGLAVIKDYDRYGMIDRNGKEVMPCKYIGLSGMIDGRCFAFDAETELAAMFDKNMKQLTDFKYNEIQFYNEGFYTARIGNQFTYLDKKGRECFGMYEELSGFFDGYSMVKKDGKYGIINRKGKIILPIEYDNSGWRTMEYIFSENLAMVEKDGKYGFVNKRGKIVIPIIYESAYHCTEGLIPVEKNGVWGYIDKEGNEVGPFEFMMASYFTWGRAEVVYNNETYKINTDGECVKNCKTYPKNLKFNFKK